MSQNYDYIFNEGFVLMDTSFNTFMEYHEYEHRYTKKLFYRIFFDDEISPLYPGRAHFGENIKWWLKVIKDIEVEDYNYPKPHSDTFWQEIADYLDGPFSIRTIIVGADYDDKVYM